MQKIADEPESFDEARKRMRDLYETNSFHPPVKEAGPEDLDGELEMED